jgi:hypothetical protein
VQRRSFPEARSGIARSSASGARLGVRTDSRGCVIVCQSHHAVGAIGERDRSLEPAATSGLEVDQFAQWLAYRSSVRADIDLNRYS